MKLVLLLKSLPPEFDQQKAYILTIQNIILKEVATFLASNEVQILRDHATGLKIEATVITARMKQEQSKSAIAGKDKATSATPIEDIQCWECHEKGHFKSDCPRKKQRKPNTRASTVKANRATEFDDDDACKREVARTRLGHVLLQGCSA